LLHLFVRLQDVTHAKMRRRIENPRILLLDCPLEYKKGESQVRNSWRVSYVGCCVVWWLLSFVRVVVEIAFLPAVVKCPVPCCVLAGACHRVSNP
jgi:hypothetical protein